MMMMTMTTRAVWIATTLNTGTWSMARQSLTIWIVSIVVGVGVVLAVDARMLSLSPWSSSTWWGERMISDTVDAGWCNVPLRAFLPLVWESFGDVGLWRCWMCAASSFAFRVPIARQKWFASGPFITTADNSVWRIPLLLLFLLCPCFQCGLLNNERIDVV